MRLTSAFATPCLLFLLGSACTSSQDTERAPDPSPPTSGESAAPPSTQLPPSDPRTPSPSDALALMPEDPEMVLLIPSMEALAKHTGLETTPALVPPAFQFLFLPSQATRHGLLENGFALLASLDPETVACVAPHRGRENIRKALEELATEKNARLEIREEGPFLHVETAEIPHAAVLLGDRLAILLRSRSGVEEWTKRFTRHALDRSVPSKLKPLAASTGTGELLTLWANVPMLVAEETAPLRALEHASLLSAREKLQAVLDDPSAKESARAHWKERVKSELEWAEETREARRAEADAMDALWGGISSAIVTLRSERDGLKLSLRAPLAPDSLLRLAMTATGAGPSRKLPPLDMTTVGAALSMQVANEAVLKLANHVALAVLQQEIPASWKDGLSAQWSGGALAALVGSTREWAQERKVPPPVVFLDRRSGEREAPLPEIPGFIPTESGWRMGEWPAHIAQPSETLRERTPIAFAMTAPTLGLMTGALRPGPAKSAPSARNSIAPTQSKHAAVQQIDDEIKTIREQVRQLEREGAAHISKAGLLAFERLGVLEGTLEVLGEELRLIVQQSGAKGTLASQIQAIEGLSNQNAAQATEIRRLSAEIRKLNRARNQAERTHSRLRR